MARAQCEVWAWRDVLGVLRDGGLKTTYLVRAVPAGAREVFGLCQG